MEDFLSSIPAAASNPYSLTAYAIAALLFLFAGAKLRLAKLLLAKITSVPMAERRRVLEIATGTVLPTHISPEQWIRNNRLRWIFLLLSALLIIILVVATVAIVNPTRKEIISIKERLDKAKYPMEPLELSFGIEYPMDQSKLAKYAERLRGDIVSYLRRVREGRGATSESLADEAELFVISNNPQWQPRRTASENAATELLEDNTEFHFREHGDLGGKEVSLLSTSKDIADGIITMTRHGEISQQIELSADFARRMFAKRVLCRNPARIGSDVAALSSWDLVGRKLTWDQGVSSDLTWALVSFGIRFSYDNGFGQNGGRLPSGREITIGGQEVVEVTADHVGLASVLSTR